MSTQPEENSDNLSKMAVGMLSDPNFAKSITDLAAPMMAAQETILQQVVDQQNSISQILLNLISKIESVENKIDAILTRLST